MKLLRVSAAVINTTPLDWDGNRRCISGAIVAARAAGASILCLPEMCITGYGCEDAFHAPGLQQTALEVLQSYFMAKGRLAAEKFFWKNSVPAFRWVKRDPKQPQLT